MPVYNGAAYVHAAVTSILAQTFGDFELIAVDDGSTDGSLDALRALERGDARVRVVSRPNTGIVGALNDALAQARGQYLARMDCDDIALPDRFARQLAYLTENPGCVCVGSAVVFTDPFGSPLETFRPPINHEAIDKQLIKGFGGAMIHPAVLMRADAVRQVGEYRKEFEFVEDVDLFLRLAEVGRVANLPDVLLHYRQHLGSTNRQKSDLQLLRMGKAVGAACKRRNVTPPPASEILMKPPLERHEQTRRWGWGALKCGYVAAARKHAWILVKAHPFSVDAWKLVLCTIRGH